jgi:hypothetical protein
MITLFQSWLLLGELAASNNGAPLLSCTAASLLASALMHFPSSTRPVSPAASTQFTLLAEATVCATIVV